MRFLFLILVGLSVGLSFIACSSLPKHFEKERLGIRHVSSQALYPRKIGNYAFLNHDESQALTHFEEEKKSTAIYLDYKSGGPMTSILYRPFAKVETFPKPKKVKFDVLVAKEVQRLTRGKEVLLDNSGRNQKGTRFRQVKVTGDQAFLSEGFSGMGFNEKLPAVTKYVFLDKGDYVLFMTTSYPSGEEETLSRPNGEFVAKFIEAQK